MAADGPASCVTRGSFQNAYELGNLGALKSSLLNKLHIFQWMGKIFCVELQRVPLKFHTKYLTHTLKDTIFILCWKFKSSQIHKLVCVFETPPRSLAAMVLITWDKACTRIIDINTMSVLRNDKKCKYSFNKSKNKFSTTMVIKYLL